MQFPFFCIHNRVKITTRVSSNKLPLITISVWKWKSTHSAFAKVLKEEKSSLNTTLVSTTNIVTENNVLGRRGNWGVLNGYHGDKRGTLTRPVHSLRGSERKQCDNAEEKPVCVCVCVHTLSLTHLVLVGSVGLQRCAIAEGDTRAHSICFGRRWNHSKTITVKAFLFLQVVNAAESVRQHYEGWV